MKFFKIKPEYNFHDFACGCCSLTPYKCGECSFGSVSPSITYTLHPLEPSLRLQPPPYFCTFLLAPFMQLSSTLHHPLGCPQGTPPLNEADPSMNDLPCKHPSLHGITRCAVPEHEAGGTWALWECKSDDGWEPFGLDVDGNAISQKLEESFINQTKCTFTSQFKMTDTLTGYRIKVKIVFNSTHSQFQAESSYRINHTSIHTSILELECQFSSRPNNLLFTIHQL